LFAFLTLGIFQLILSCSPPCDDGDECTEDGCSLGDPNTSCCGVNNAFCTHSPIDCDDGDACTDDSGSCPFCTNVPIVSQSIVYVDDSFLGTTPFTDPDGAGPATSFGCDSFATIQAGVDAVSNGGTVRVAQGIYNENVVIDRAMTLQGAKVGIDARDRLPGETVVVASSATRTVELRSTTGPIVIDGFSFSGGLAPRLIESTSGNVNGLQIRNNRFTSHVGFAIFLNNPGTDVTIEQNELDGSSSTGAGAAIHLDVDNFGGFVLLNNRVRNYGTRTGFFVDGNHNVGESATRSSSLAGNTFSANSIGASIGARAFGTLNAPTLGLFGGSIVDNVFSNNLVDGLQGGPQHVLVARNTFSGNGRHGIALTSFGNTAADRGAQNSLIRSNTVVGNGFAASLAAGISLSASQAAGTIATNPITFNRIAGNFQGVSYAGAEAIVAENNWWGCSAGPKSFGGAGCGDALIGANVDFNPWTVMCVTALPSPLPTIGGGTSLVSAKLTRNSDGAVPSTVVFIRPASIAFSATQGSMSPTNVAFDFGVATSTFTPATAVTGTACATLDAETVSALGNDECAGATPISAGSATAFTSICASTSAPAFSCAASGANDLWFSFTAPDSGLAAIDTCAGASFDTVIEVYSACGGATVGCNDNSAAAAGCTSGSGRSSVSWFATSGTNYFIRVGGAAGASGTGTLTLAFSSGSCPFPATPLAGCPTPSFVFQQSPSAGVCALISSEPVPGGVVSINGWTVIPPNPSASAALAPFIGDYRRRFVCRRRERRRPEHGADLQQRMLGRQDSAHDHWRVLVRRNIRRSVCSKASGSKLDQWCRILLGVSVGDRRSSPARRQRCRVRFRRQGERHLRALHIAAVCDQHAFGRRWSEAAIHCAGRCHVSQRDDRDRAAHFPPSRRIYQRH
jgi:hypothetical protein